MILGIPLTIWLGFLTFLLIVIQVSLGVAMTVFRKPVLKYHRITGFTILGLAVVHMILGILLWFYGVLI